MIYLSWEVNDNFVSRSLAGNPPTLAGRGAGDFWELGMHGGIRDLTGRVFGRLTVISITNKRVHRSVCWFCRCSCGNEVIIRSDCLMTGGTKSCGCLQREITSARCKGERNHHWNGGRRTDGDGYIHIYSPNHPNKSQHNYVQEHRLVMEKHLGRHLAKEEMVHHMNGLRYDNRIENLRLFPTRGTHAAYHAKLRRERKTNIHPSITSQPWP